METITNRSKQLAQSASAIGAALLGFGIGVKWGAALEAYSIPVIAIGAIIHIYGMYFTQMKNTSKRTDTIAKVLWLSAWICLLALVALFVYFNAR